MGQSDPQWGRYHASASVMMALFKMPAAWFQLSLLFLSPNVRFRCALPLNKSVLPNMSEGVVWDDSCEYRDENDSLQTCQRWQYDRQEYTHTVNMLWNLVCDRVMLATWAQVSFMCGVSLGTILGGLVASRVGRKPVLVVAVLLQPLFSAIVAVVPTFSLFLIFRFLLGLALGGTIAISFVLGGELASGQWRPVITILNQVPFGIGQTIVALTAYFLRDWREIQMALSVYCVIFLPYCWLVEESPKWLLEKGKVKQAEQVMTAIRRRNRLPSTSHTELHPMTERQKVEIVKIDNNNVSGKKDTVGFCDMFSTPRLSQYTLSVWIMWYCAGLGFFSMNAYQTQLGGSGIVNVGVGGLVGGIPGNIVTVFLVRRFSKKKIIIIAHILAAVFAILIPVYDVGEATWDWQRRLMGLCTLLAMSVAYPVLFLMSGELLPTVVRSSVMSVANVMARLGNTTAPLVIVTAAFHRWVPLCLIAAAPLVTVALALGLPDSGNGPLPHSIQDIELPVSHRKPDNVCTAEDSQIYKPVSAVDQDS